MKMKKSGLMRNDDIVTRLREVACDNRWCGNDPHCRLCDGIDEIERLRKALEQCIFERDTWRNLYDKERGGADYIGDDRYLHEPAGEVPKGKTRRL